MFKRIYVLTSVLFLSQSAFSATDMIAEPAMSPPEFNFPLASTAPIDVTTDFVNYVTSHFVGQTSAADKRYDYRRNGIGKVVFGEGSGRVSQLLSWTGRGFRYGYEEDIWGAPTATVKLGIDTSFTFAYEGKTKGKAQCYTPVGNSGCGDEWGELHPEGRILIDVNADNNDGYIVHIRYDVISDDDGRPSEVVRLAMQGLQNKAVDVITTFARRYKANVRFVVYN